MQGVVELVNDHEVCKAGQKLDPHQASEGMHARRGWRVAVVGRGTGRGPEQGLGGSFPVCAGRGCPPRSPPSPNTLQAALLRIFDQRQAAFRIKLLALWQDDEVETIDAHDGEGSEGEEEDEPEGVAFPDDEAAMMLPA